MEFRQEPSCDTAKRNQQYRLAKLPILNIYFLGKVGKICRIVWIDTFDCGVTFNDEKGCDVQVPYNCLEYVGG